MSVTIAPDALEITERVLSEDEIYRLGLELSMPSPDGKCDLIEAHKWFNIASMMGNAQARVYRKELTVDMTTEEIAQAQRAARAWFNARKGAIRVTSNQNVA